MTSAEDREAELPSCAWCGRSLADDGVRLAGRIRCPACGVATTDPWPTDADLEAAYGTWYRPDSGRFSGLGDRILKRSRGLLAKRLDEAAPAGRVLDVGAGDGALLDALHKVGRDAVGLERHSTRPDVIETPLDELPGPWAAIVFWHSLEHLRRPAGALGYAAGLLAPGGLLVIAVPNAASLQARLFGDRWLALDLPRHLVHIPARALRSALEEEGLTVERESPLRGGQVLFGWLHGLVALLPGELDLYDAIRRPEARSRAMSPSQRLTTLAAAVLVSPLALLGMGAEAVLGRGGTVYMEARRG